MSKPRYRVSVYDANIDDTEKTWPADSWRVRYKACTKWGLRKALRKLYSEGYDRDASLMVERFETEEIGAPAKKPGQRELFT